MSGNNYRFAMDQKDIIRSLTSTVGSFLQDRLIDKHQRTQHKDQCAERLAAEDTTSSPNSDRTEVRYSDQAVLANLDWGIDALEEAINTSNIETKMARLNYSEKMLQVCAMLNSGEKTAGVPNSYLSAWAHLNLSYLHKLRNENNESVLQVLEMFIIDPFFSRIDFAPELWKLLFLPHMGSVIGWYAEERRKIVMGVIPEDADLSLTVDFDQYFDKSLILSVRPDQAEKIQRLERDYGRLLDDNTRLYAKYYTSLEATTSCLKNLEDFTPWDNRGEEGEDSGDDRDLYTEIRDERHETFTSRFRAEKDDDTRSVVSTSRVQLLLEMQSHGHSPQNSSPVSSSTKTPSTRISSPNSVANSCKLHMSMLRLLSTRASQPGSPLSCHDSSSVNSADSDGEIAGTVGQARSVRQVFPNKGSLTQNDDASPTAQSRPPKDFVCPITGQIFTDPVTLETGQTYETQAIQEWMNRGNTTCPITRQPLSAASLPKTNYVLKRLINSWKEQHPDLAQEFSCAETPRSYKTQRFSPTSVISQAAVESVITALKPYILCLCNSENLQECESAVLTISTIWEDSNIDSAINSHLSSPTVVNGFVEILSASQNKEVLRTTIYILSKLIHADDRVIELLTSIDSDFDCLADLLNKGLAEAATLMYLLRPSFSNLKSHNLIATLIRIVSNENEVLIKDAAIGLLERIVVGGDESDRWRNALEVISENGIIPLMKCMSRIDERRSILSILLCCIRVDMNCRNVVANRIELTPVLELFHGGNDSVRGICVEFLCELVQLSRRTLCNQILQIIREEGTFSTMHTLLVYLQMSPMEQKPGIAALLLQLDLLAAPRKMSIYREEAMSALLEALQRKDFPSLQLMALEALSSLSGHSRASKKAYMESCLLMLAGFEEPYNTMRMEEVENNEKEFTETTKEEEKSARSWEKRMAFVLTNHEKGTIFKALEECFMSNSVEIAKACLVVTTWLVHMLYTFPDCGIRDVARKLLLDKYINVLQSSKNIEEKILAVLALRGFVNERGGLNEVGLYAKCMWKTLRRLKKSCTVAHDVMKALMNLPSIDAAELWACVEGPELDESMNGEILSMLHLRNRLISSHSDGTIKVWDTGKRAPRLIQEVREHSKAVTCLYVPPLCDKLYSGSLDKTIRVWSIKQEEIYCIQVHDVKEAVHVLIANASFACFSSHGNGVKVYNWSGVPKQVNFNKQVKCLALAGDKLYCGCSGYSIQELDLKTQILSTFYSGAKKLLGKQTIYSMEIHNGLLFAGGSSVDGIAGKVFSLSSKAVLGYLSTGSDIQQISASNDFIFTAKSGFIEVWQIERVIKIASIKMRGGGSARITSLASDIDAQKLFAGTSDGKIQVWNLD